MTRPTQMRVNLASLRDNYRLARSMTPHSKTMAVVKADAYGHGLVPVATALSDDAPAFAVAYIEEAIALRDAGIEQPILLLEGPFEPAEIAIACEQNFWLMATGAEQVEMICRARPRASVQVWLKVDSGMHRLGLQGEAVMESYKQLIAAEHVHSEIILATHFASADHTSRDTTSRQLARFREYTSGIHAPKSFANSAGLLQWEDAQSDWNRAGIMLYGASPFAGHHRQADKLRPVMTLTSAVIAVRDVPTGESVGYAELWTAQRPSRIATVAIGYGDGYPLSLPNGTPVMIKNTRAPLAGRVSMDMITVDVTDLPSVAVGDPVELWGEQLSVNEVAQYADSISYELLTRIPARMPRNYDGI